MKNYFSGIFLLLVFFSCSEDSDLLLDNINENQESTLNKSSEVSITKEGFLSFSSFNALETIISNIELGEKIGVKPQTIVTRAINRDFESISALRECVDRDGGGGGYTAQLPTSDDDIEEMSIHEYRLMKAEELLLDNVLTEVLDTTLRIGVDDIVYKITDFGTFSAHKSKVALIDKAITLFSPSEINNHETGASIKLNSDVTFTNSFGRGGTTTNRYASQSS